jgi:hypothetical protein
MSVLKKVNAIISVFKEYQPRLSVVEQITLLTVWIEVCVEREEYELAGRLKKEMMFIQKNPMMVPQRTEGELDVKDLVNNPLTQKIRPEIIEVVYEDDEEEIVRTPIYKQIINWFKNSFNGGKNKRN